MTLSHVKVEIFYGKARDKAGERILIHAQRRAEKSIEGAADKLLGGWTAYETRGGWQGVREPGGVIMTTIRAGDLHLTENIRLMADAIKAALNQESVYIVTTPVMGLEY